MYQYVVEHILYTLECLHEMQRNIRKIIYCMPITYQLLFDKLGMVCFRHKCRAVTIYIARNAFLFFFGEVLLNQDQLNI